MVIPENPEQTSAPGGTGGTTPAGAESFVNAEDKAWFENLLDQAKGRPLTPEENQKIAEKLKAYDSRYSVERNELKAQKEEVSRLVSELKSYQAEAKTSQSLATTKREGVKLLDNLIEDTSDPNARESLRHLREIIRQETGLEQLQKDVTELRQALQGVRETTQSSRYTALQTEIKDLEKRYGDAVVGKYRDALIQYGTQYPNYSARRLFHMVADPDEIEQSIELQARKKTQTPVQEQKKTTPVATTPQHPSEKYRAKSPKDIQRGFRTAVGDAVDQAMGKVAGL